MSQPFTIEQTHMRPQDNPLEPSRMPALQSIQTPYFMHLGLYYQNPPQYTVQFTQSDPSQFYTYNPGYQPPPQSYAVTHKQPQTNRQTKVVPTHEQARRIIDQLNDATTIKRPDFGNTHKGFWGKNPQEIECPYCNYSGMSRTERKSGIGTVCLCLTLASIFFLCSFLALGQCEDVAHYCSNCSRRLGTCRYCCIC